MYKLHINYIKYDMYCFPLHSVQGLFCKIQARSCDSGKISFSSQHASPHSLYKRGMRVCLLNWVSEYPSIILYLMLLQSNPTSLTEKSFFQEMIPIG